MVFNLKFITSSWHVDTGHVIDVRIRLALLWDTNLPEKAGTTL